MAADVGRELPTRAVIRRAAFRERDFGAAAKQKGTASAVPVL